MDTHEGVVITSVLATAVLAAVLFGLGYDGGAPLRHLLGILPAAGVSAITAGWSVRAHAALSGGAALAFHAGLTWGEGVLARWLLPPYVHMSVVAVALARTLYYVATLRRRR